MAANNQTILLFDSFICLLNKHNIKYWLLAGTLLGSVRNEKMIEWDDDIDIGLDVEDYWKVRELLDHQNYFAYHAIWRREICVTKPGCPRNVFHVDMFFIENTDNASYIYSYKINSFTNIWDIEQRQIFPKNIFKETKDWVYETIPIRIPVKFEEILSLHYGDWKTPQQNWTANDIPNWDKDYREIAIVIPTFLRFNKLKLLLESILKIYPDSWYRLYIADQGIYSLENDNFYDNLREKGHKISYIPFNCGLAFARNYLVKQTVEPFILILDDDFEITEETKIQNFVNILLKNKEIGIVGGTLIGHQNYNYDLFLKNEILYYVVPNKKNFQEAVTSYVQNPPIKFYYQDIVLNFSMFRREVFKDILWNPELKMAEHTDFYLRLKTLSKWSVAFTDSVQANHQSHKDEIKEYLLFRKNINSKIGQDKCFETWKIDPSKVIYLKEK
jgi:hypothetical protein